MKKKLMSIFGLMVFLFTSVTLEAQMKTMTWTSSSEKAVQLCSEGVDHFFNFERAQAYDKFNQALAEDPNFTIPLVFVTILSRGDTRKANAEKTANSLAGKTEGEKLFASTVADGSTQESRKATFEKLYTMFPDGRMLGGFYIFSITDPEAQFNASEAYQKKFPEMAWIQNLIGYYYMLQKKDMAMAKKCFDKYLEMYPEGCNPYDSMGEYFFNNGDMENSEKYYNKSLEKYPFNNSSINKLQEINAAKEKKSDR